MAATRVDLPNDVEAIKLARLFAKNPDLRRGVSNEGFDEAHPDPVLAMRFCIDFLYYYIIFAQDLKAFPSSRDEIDLTKVQEALETISDFCGYTLTITDASQEYLDQVLPGTKFCLSVKEHEPIDKWWFVDANLNYLITFAPRL